MRSIHHPFPLPFAPFLIRLVKGFNNSTAVTIKAGIWDTI